MKSAAVTTAKKPTPDQGPSKKASKPTSNPKDSGSKVPSKVTPIRNEEKDTAKKADTFPNVSKFPKSDMVRAIELLQEDVELAKEGKAITEARDKNKEEMILILKRNKIASGSGVKWGTLAAYYSDDNTKRTLDPKLLLENGVTVEQLNESYKESKPFIKLQVLDLAKKPDGD